MIGLLLSATAFGVLLQRPPLGAIRINSRAALPLRSRAPQMGFDQDGDGNVDLDDAKVWMVGLFKPDKEEIVVKVEKELGTNYPGDNFFAKKHGDPESGKGLYVPAPAKEITGLDESITQMCATMASAIYEANLGEEADNAPKTPTAPYVQNSGKVLFESTIAKQAGDDGAELVLFDDHDGLKRALPPMATVIYGDTMIIAWRGSVTPLDWVNDFNVTPILSRAWKGVAPGIRVHSGVAGLMESEMALHEEHFVEAIKKNPRVKRVVFTGHSLGGGLAAVAQLFALGSWAKDVPQVEEWRTLAFEGLAVFYVDEKNTDPLTKNVLKQFAEYTRNFAFCGDAVPRAPSNADYIEEVIDGVVDDMTDGPPFIIHKLMKKKLGDMDDVKDRLAGVLEGYKHYSKIIHYEDPQQKVPQLLEADEFDAIKFSDYAVYDDLPTSKYHYYIHGVIPYAMSPQYKNLTYNGHED